ncbi:alginate lyase family protein [Tianweitania sp.]|uniref:heparinase II/III family protein n=1 Tax=Tianweitania sp. TaxID=2021634 RepID=UPI00289D2EDA|nr:alginate lyase family protein [Tianweitania sp.]
MTGPNAFLFLNEAGMLDANKPGAVWDDPARSKLWRYNLHYFDELNAERAADRREWHTALISDWLEHNPPGHGTGWEPFPTSLRIVNWIKAAQDGFTLPADALHSLAIQTRWLARRVEHHLSGNHLLANAKALCFAGAFFEGAEADVWFKQGSRLLRRELPQQVLPDGGHYELSPMYHALVLEDLLALINLSRRFGTDQALQGLLEARINPMRTWLVALSHPDGEIAFFNDAALSIAPPPAALNAYAERLGFASATTPSFGLTHLKQSGYVRVTHGPAVLLIDAAEVGPAHQPGHAHADTLSFELSLHGKRVLVNGGTSEYGTGPERLRQRGTAAHNTLIIDGFDSSEVWSGFRVGRRAHPHDLHIVQGGNDTSVTASHDGYRFLTGNPMHHRRWRLEAETLTIHDEVSGPPRKAEARYHFAPDINLFAQANCGFAEQNGRLVLRWEVVEGLARIEPDTHHPGFGVSLAAQCLILACDNNRATLRLIFVEEGT